MKKGPLRLRKYRKKGWPDIIIHAFGPEFPALVCLIGKPLIRDNHSSHFFPTDTFCRMPDE